MAVGESVANYEGLKSLQERDVEVVYSIRDLRLHRQKLASPVGFVPTMGYLHAGHLSLVQRARQECASIVVSIFVNPAQFGPQEDLASYPRDLERDLALLQSEGVHLVWAPLVEEMYPSGYQTWVTVDDLAEPLEGSLRPGHFRGVATVVTKLLNAVQPDMAYFGQKDAQQAALIQQLVRDLNLPVQIVVCPIVREPDGLAMSSRNTYLNPEERAAATILYRALRAAQATFQAGERDAAHLRQVMQEILAQEPLAQPQYAVCVDAATFQELETISGEALLLLAVYIGKTRLIDNCKLSIPE